MLFRSTSFRPRINTWKKKKAGLQMQSKKESFQKGLVADFSLFRPKLLWTPVEVFPEDLAMDISEGDGGISYTPKHSGVH